jgi:hypothetical protein
LNLDDIVRIYPGADEVPFALLSRYAVDKENRPPKLGLVFRSPDSIDLIPNFEGDPMIETLLHQIEAAGGIAVNASILTRGDITLMVNNFESYPQL